MKEIDFLIIYEHKNREFESIALLKHELVRRGYTVEFISFYEYNRKKRKRLFNNVNIVVMPSLYHDKEVLNFAYMFAGKVKNVVNLRWEQLFSNITEQNLDYYVYPKQNAKNAYHFCWGKRPYEMLCKAGVNKEKLFIAGPIHMDLLRKDIRALYLDKYKLFIKYNIDLNKECILFTSSFSASSMSESEVDWFISQFEGEEKEYMKRYIPREIESRNNIVEWLSKLAEIRDCTIIYRPHPAESNNELIEQLKQKNNIKVINDFNIKQWILTCDQVFTWNSTSIVEASVAGVPCAVLRPVKLHPDDEIPIYDGFSQITTFEQFCESYDNNVSSESSLLVDNEKIHEYYDIDPDTPSYIRTADVLEKALKDDYYFPWENFPAEKLKEIENSVLKPHYLDVLAKIIVGPFYSFSLPRKVLWRVCGKLIARYGEIKSSKTPPITDEEFREMEEKISAVLSQNESSN